VLPRLIFRKFILFIAVVFCFPLAQANFNLTSLKRVVIFPARGVDDSILDELWWQIREQVANDGRFEVATRRLMINRQVLAPRGELKPSDAVILGRILEADMLMTHQLDKKKATLYVVRASDGVSLFKEELPLNPAIPESDQVIPIFKTLVSNFLKLVPYAGYQIPSPFSNLIYEPDGSLGFVYVMIPKSESLVNSKVFWVNTIYFNQPLLKSKPNFQPFNFGQAIEFIKPNILRVRIEKPFDENTMTAGTPVYLENSGSQSEGDSIFGSKMSEISSEYLMTDTSPNRRVTEQSPQATFLGMIASLAAMLLLIL
jgi:hypothetical protein